MPRGDGTGPNGMGSMSGRNLGYCNGYETPGFAKGGRCGAGFGGRRGRNFARGFRRENGFANAMNRRTINNEMSQNSQADEANYLFEEIKVIKDQLKVLETKLAEINQEN